MDLTFMMEYMSICVVGICLCVGFMLKNAVTTDKVNKYIPMFMGMLGLILNLWIMRKFSAEVVLGGLFSGLASTGLYEAFTNLIKRGE